MKNVLFILLFGLSSLAHGQINFKTGDVKLEAELNLVNKDAEKDLPTFKSGLVKDFGITKPKIDDLLKIMKPAEVLLTLRISKIVNKPIEKVVQSYQINKTKGWGVIAKQMGIKPGSPEFHALKGKSNDKSPKGNGNSNGNSNSQGKGKK